MTAATVLIEDIDIGQRWRDRHTGDRFRVLRTYHDNPVNPGYLIEYEPPAPGWHSRGKSTVTFGFFRAYCERIEDSASDERERP